MDFTILESEHTFLKWKDYAPWIVQYCRYSSSNPSVIAAGHKIEDVYYAFTNARANFLFAYSDDFGGLVGDDSISQLFAKTNFLTTALLEYSLTLDLSWQVIWAYTQPASLEYLMEQKYSEMQKYCDRESVLSQLDCAISTQSPGYTQAIKLKEIMIEFDNDENTLKLRSIYNYVKHQGTIHFSGLGMNDKTIPVQINGKTPPMLHRHEYSIEDIEDILFNYHFSFIKYFESIIQTIIPEDYLGSTLSLGDALTGLINMEEAMPR